MTRITTGREVFERLLESVNKSIDSFSTVFTEELDQTLDPLTRNSKTSDGSLFFRVPGFSREDLEISIEDDRLLIKGKKEICGSTCVIDKSYFLFLSEIDVDLISAEVKDGILKIIIPKKKVDKKSRSIKIS